MKYLPVLLLSFLFFSCQKWKDRKYVHGEIYLENGDVIPGELKLKGLYKGFIPIISDSSGKKEKYHIRRVNSMHINMIRFGKIYVNGKPMMLEKVAYGKFNLYAFDRQQSDRVFRFYYLDVSYEILLVKPENLHEVISTHFDDYPQLVGKVKQWNMENFPSLVRKVNVKAGSGK